MALTCPSCSADLSASDRFCRSCGALVGAASELPTGLVAPAAAHVAIADGGAAPIVNSPVGRLVSSSSVEVGGFAPGTVLAGRYRIIGLLGRGGMGEVYRADDLKLGQTVALKFLPKAVSDDPELLDRFHAEVRLARQVSHPNVCRVYDIGEVEGRHFLSMEYIDGEDLASLLRRIGRLPADKGLEIGRQLCAALAAAHDRGVLHRDLKPANVMLDGRGKVRLTDFGLAEVEGSGAGAAAGLAGTPAYMAPEQFTGQPASVASDLYALGLVLYEIFSGKRAFEAPTLAEIRRLHEQSHAARLSTSVHDLDPAIERVIFRCLEKSPSDRPASAMAVARVRAEMLPGTRAMIPAAARPIAFSDRRDPFRQRAVLLVALNAGAQKPQVQIILPERSELAVEPPSVRSSALLLDPAMRNCSIGARLTEETALPSTRAAPSPVLL